MIWPTSGISLKIRKGGLNLGIRLNLNIVWVIIIIRQLICIWLRVYILIFIVRIMLAAGRKRLLIR
jgi:hypothetical protein